MWHSTGFRVHYLYGWSLLFSFYFVFYQNELFLYFVLYLYLFLKHSKARSKDRIFVCPTHLKKNVIEFMGSEHILRVLSVVFSCEKKTREKREENWEKNNRNEKEETREKKRESRKEREETSEQKRGRRNACSNSVIWRRSLNPFTCTNNFTFVYSTDGDDDTFIEKLLLNFLTFLILFIKYILH